MAIAQFQTDRRWQQLRKLTEVSRALTYALSIDEVLSLAVRRAAELLRAEKSVLMLLNEDGLLSVRASHGLDPATCERFREPLQETLIIRLQGLLDTARPEEFLGVPLVVRGEVTGLLAVARPPREDTLDEDEWLLSALADQAALALEKTRLDETAEFRERLIGIVSHDLRDPIAAIAMAVEGLLRHEGLDERTTTTAIRIQSATGRAKTLIADLLDFTQARLGGGLRIDRKPADLHAIVQQVMDEITLAHPDRTLQATHRGDGQGEWDPDRIAQIIDNLVSNAIHYSPPDTTVRLTTEADDQGITISVHNVGKPIPPERLPHVFEPLRRAVSELPKTTRSVGLGLYIVKHLVEAHEGTVSVDSSADEGTTFTVRLPR